MSKTPHEWLALGDKLPVELARVFVPREEWKHKWHEGYCMKCDVDPRGCPPACSVPDRITIDWKEAKYQQGKCDVTAFFTAARQVFKVVYPDGLAFKGQVCCWLAELHKPEDAKYVLVIAAMAVGRN